MLKNIVFSAFCVMLLLSFSCGVEQAKNDTKQRSGNDQELYPGQETDGESPEDEVSPDDAENNSDESEASEDSDSAKAKPVFVAPKFKHLPQKYWDRGLEMWKRYDD